MKIKKIIISLVLCLLIFPIFSVSAEEKVEINFFYSLTCPHCAEEKDFLEDIEKKYPHLQINRYVISENIDLLKTFYKKYEVKEDVWGLVPITFTEDDYFLGFNDEIAFKIEDCLVSCLKKADLFEESQSCSECENVDHSNPIKDRDFKIPFFGKIDVNGMSPVLLSIVIGALDGFNACAMVALGFLLTILVSTGIRKRVVLIGGVFILVSGLIYFIFISAKLLKL